MHALSMLVVLVVALVLILAPVTDAAKEQMFGLLFPELPKYDAPDDATLVKLTAELTATNGKSGPMLDDTDTARNNPDEVPAFFTYFGQFLDHDMTLDSLPLPDDFVDPNTIVNGRDQRLNLDSVYGLRRKQHLEVYEKDRKRFKVNGLDLARNADGSAIIVDKRNDENQVIAQLHVAFLRAHNKLIDQGYKFADARDLMEWRFQWIVVHEFLPEVLDPEVYADVFRPDGTIRTQYFDPKRAARADMPVEFAVAAYRFGHSQVRRAYRIIENGSNVQVFDGTANDLHGGRLIAQDHIIFWPNFINIDGVPPTGVDGQPANISRKIDPLLSKGLFGLPIPGAIPGGPSILAMRNIQRAREYGLPSGQDVARRLGLRELTNAEIAEGIPSRCPPEPQNPNPCGSLAKFDPDDPTDRGILSPAFIPTGGPDPELPLWLYILAESQIVHNGAKLGPVGSRIVAEVIGGLIAAHRNSFYRRGWVPEGGDFRAQDLLREADVLPAS
jgi:Animal haem peroxidase